MVRREGTEALLSRLWQDSVRLPIATRGVRVAHFPSIPPSVWTGARRVAYTLHDLTWWKFPDTASRMGRSYYAWLASRAIRRGAHLVTDTQAMAEEIQDHFRIPPDRVTPVPLGVDLPHSTERLHRTRPYLLTVATVEPRKNLARLAEAYRQSGVSATHDLVVVGRPGWGTVVPGMDVLSGLDDRKLVAAYSGATAVVLASLYEGFGLPAVEAMQLGIPVICSDIPVLREVTGGRASFVDPLSVDSIAGALLAATLEPTSPVSAQQWARTTWSWDTTVTELSKLYRRLDDGT